MKTISAADYIPSRLTLAAWHPRSSSDRLATESTLPGTRSSPNLAEWLKAPVLASLIRNPVFCRIATIVISLHVGLSSLGYDFFRCPLADTFHIPCPGCGLTRGVKALLMGNLEVSLHYHAFASIALIAFMILALGSVLSKRSREYAADHIARFESHTRISQVLFLMLWLYWLCRLMLVLLEPKLTT